MEASLFCAVEEIKNAIQTGERSVLETMDLDINNLTFDKIVEAYNKGDQVTIKSIRKIAHMLGKGISTLIHIMNPEKSLLVVVVRYLVKPCTHRSNLQFKNTAYRDYLKIQP